MTNPFAQNIGIWYATCDDSMMVQIMDNISQWCSEYKEREVHNKFERSIVLKDGTCIRTILATDNARGNRCSTSFIVNPHNINQQIVDSIIRPSTTVGGGVVYVIDSSDKNCLWDELHRCKILR